MTYTASEMRSVAKTLDERSVFFDAEHAKHPRKGHNLSAQADRKVAQMLRQAADAMESRKLDFLGRDFDAYMVALSGAAPGSDPYRAVLGFMGSQEYRDRELGRTLARMLTAHCRAAMQDKGE